MDSENLGYYGGSGSLDDIMVYRLGRTNDDEFMLCESIEGGEKVSAPTRLSRIPI